MANIIPFKALKFNRENTERIGSIETLTCPPYDIISDEEYKNYIQNNEYNIIRLELPKSDDGDRYAEAGERLKKWIADGVLIRDENAGIYIYEEEFLHKGEKKRFKGIICLVKLEPFSNGVVLPHEETLSKAKTDRLNLMKATGCNFSQIYSLYNDEAKNAKKPVKEIIDQNSKETPEIEFTDSSEVTHRLWGIYDSDALKKLEEEFLDKKLYIADGHHRYETALNYSNYLNEKGQITPDAGYVMMMLVDLEDEGLVVFPTHRIVRGLENFDSESLLEKCNAYFNISDAEDGEAVNKMLSSEYDRGNKAFALYSGGKYKVLVLKSMSFLDEIFPNSSEAYKGLDVSVLHSLVLERLLGIDKENMAAQINLTYTRTAEEAVRAVDNKTANCCFILNPTRVEEIRDVALAGEKMPQKSTYFYPKLITGLIMNNIGSIINK